MCLKRQINLHKILLKGLNSHIYGVWRLNWFKVYKKD